MNYVQAQEYLWPTNSGNYLSSTFGETRSVHFHAGLDIKTWGQEGYKVFASKDGILYRLLVTERGYGNAIYLKHPDNTYTVYAHLQRFNDRFHHLMDSVRLKDYSFEKDLILDSLQIQVKQGETIGYTGSTGIGPPHLHFEIRDSLQHPVNALTSNLSIEDNLAPVFSSLIVEPLNANTRIEGKPVSLFKKAQKAVGNYSFGSVEASGKIGLAVNVFDRADDVYNAYAVYSLGLRQGTDTLFYQELNHFDYTEAHEMFLDRIAPFGSNRRGHQRLYGKEGHNNPFYLIEDPQSRISVSDSAQNYTIFASDYFGNTAEASIQFILSNSDKNTTIFDLSNISIPTKNWYWTEDWVSPDLEHTLDLNNDLEGFRWAENQMLYFSDSSVINFARLNPESGHRITSPDQKLLIRFPRHTFFDTLTVATSHFKKAGNTFLSIQPQMIPSKSAYSIALYLGDDFEEGNKYRLFRIKNSDGDLSYVDSYQIGKTLHANPNVLGEFQVLADSVAPMISDFKIYKTDYGKWEASVQVKDNLTEIDSGTAIFEINGKRGIPIYDYEEEILIYHHPDFIPAGSNSVSVRVKDKAGNTAFFEIKE